MPEIQPTDDKPPAKKSLAIPPETHDAIRVALFKSLASEVLQPPFDALIETALFYKTINEIPEGSDGIQWIQKHRTEIFPGTVIELNNANASLTSMFFRTAVVKAMVAKCLDRVGWKFSQLELSKVRDQAARILGLNEKDKGQRRQIAFIPNTRSGIQLIADSVQFARGDELIIGRGDWEYPTNYGPWKKLEKTRRVKIIEIGDERGIITPSDVMTAIGKSTRLVALSSIGYKNGHRLNLEMIGKIIAARNLLFPKKRRTLFVVDGIQTVGALPLDVKKCGIDFLATGGSKWLLSGNRIGILYISEVSNQELYSKRFEKFKQDEIRARRVEGEIAEQRMIDILGFYEELLLLHHLGVQNIERTIIELTDQLCVGLKGKGYSIFSPRKKDSEKSGIVVFTARNWEEITDESKRSKIIIADIGLKERNGNYELPGDPPISIALRGGRVRVSPAFYNTERDINELLERLPLKDG